LSTYAFAKIDAATQKDRAFQASSPKTFGRFLLEPAFFFVLRATGSGFARFRRRTSHRPRVTLAFAGGFCERGTDNDKPTERPWVNQ
jgi:hypothetical protein